jgi:hypothetical protein
MGSESRTPSKGKGRAAEGEDRMEAGTIETGRDPRFGHPYFRHRFWLKEQQGSARLELESCVEDMNIVRGALERHLDIIRDLDRVTRLVKGTAEGTSEDS